MAVSEHRLRKIREYAKRYRERHPDRIAAKNRLRPERGKQSAAYHRDWRARNPEKSRAIIRRYDSANAEAKRCRVRNRRARLRTAPGTHSAEDIARIYAEQDGRCASPWCRVALGDAYHVDHNKPVSKGGSNGPENLKLRCAPCNQQKGDKDPVEWERYNMARIMRKAAEREGVMGQISAKLRSVVGGHAHYCPGCEGMHVIPDRWKFDGNVDRPTFTPSVKITYNGSDADKVDEHGHRAPTACCHYILTAGILNFCGDSTHKLAGLQSVELPDLPERLKDWC